MDTAVDVWSYGDTLVHVLSGLPEMDDRLVDLDELELVKMLGLLRNVTRSCVRTRDVQRVCLAS